MPLYSYQCKRCYSVFDLLVGIEREKPALKCPSCGSSEIEKAWRFFKINFREKKSLSCSSCRKSNCANCGRN